MYSTVWYAVATWSVMPCLLWGMALALLHHEFAERFTAKNTLSIGGVLLVSGVGLRFVFTTGLPVFEAVGGLGLLILTMTPMNSKARVLQLAAKYGPCTFGIYLSHVVFIRLLHIVFVDGLGLSGGLGFEVAFWAASLGLSVAAVSLLARSERTRWLIASDAPAKRRQETRVQAPTRMEPEWAVAA